MNRPSIIKSRHLAARLGVSPKTLWDLGQRNAKLRSCIVDGSTSSPWWSVALLIAAGFLIDDRPAADEASRLERKRLEREREMSALERRAEMRVADKSKETAHVG